MFLGIFSGFLGLIAQCAAVCFWLYSAGYGLQRISENKGAGLLMGFFSLAMAGATAYCVYSQFRFAKEDRHFKSWLVANAEKIRNNQLAFFRGQRISLDTVLVRHHLVFSAVFISFRMKTRWIIKDKEPRFWHALAASLYTLCYGWWGFPFGIFWTPVALIKNLNGSTCVRVEALLQPALPKSSAFGQRFQNNFSRRLQAAFFVDEVPTGILPAQTAGKV